MNHTATRVLACLLCGILLVSSVACTRQPIPEVTEGTTAPEVDVTEPETAPPPEDFEVTEENGTAQVLTPMGLSYTVTGYTHMNKGTASFAESLTYAFPEEAFEGKFNRFTLTYTATEPMKVWVSYTEQGRETEEYYFLEAGSGSFSGMNVGFLTGYTARKLTALRVETCTGRIADFTLTGLTTERLSKRSYSCSIENDRFKLGVDLKWGGTIHSIEDKACPIAGLCNLVNKHDVGRLIQQSYYGTGPIEGVYNPGVSFDSQWSYNPVQGGDQYNNPSRLIDLVITENTIYIKSQPQDWSLNGQLTPSYTENTYTLEEDCIRVDNRFTDFSGWEHPYHAQELPALYTVSYLDTFVWYNGENPWTGDALVSRGDLPFWGDHAAECSFPLREGNTETWCAWVNGGVDYGLGLYVPNVDQHKAGRYLYDGSMDPDAESTSYVAPINIIRMVAFKPITYSYLLTAGTTAAIRETFTANKDFTDNASLRENYQSTRLPSVEGSITQLDFTAGKNLSLLSSPMDTRVVYDEGEGAAKLTAGAFGDVSVTVPYHSAPAPLSASEYTTLRIEYCIPAGNSYPAYQCDLFLCAGNVQSPNGDARLRLNLISDGEYHVLEVDLSESPYWTDTIHSVRFDYFDHSAEGDVMYIKSMTLE